MRGAVFAIFAFAAATQAVAQTSTAPAPITQPGPARQVAPGTPGGTVVVPGGREKSSPGSSAVVGPTGTGSTTIMTDWAAGGNAGQPERAVPPDRSRQRGRRELIDRSRARRLGAAAPFGVGPRVDGGSRRPGSPGSDVARRPGRQR
jgi:hypothetical protein